MKTDPLLGPVPRYENPAIGELEQRLEQLRALDRQRVNVQVEMPYPAQQPAEAGVKTTVWDDIREELNDMSEAQRRILFQDEEYLQGDAAISAVAAQYQMQLLIPYLLRDKEGKKALEKQLVTIRTKKEDIARMEAEEQAEFRRWKEEKARARAKSKQ